MHVERFEAAGGTLAVRRRPGTGPGWVALHGFGLHGGQFSALAQAGRWALDAPDLPGHGLTTVHPVDLDTTIVTLAGWLEQAAPRPLLGYSQGGRIALHVAWRHPDLVGALVVVSAGPGLPAAARARRAVDDAAVADLIERDGIDAYLDAWLDDPVFGTTRLRQDSRERDRRLRLDNTAAGLAAARRGLGQGALPDVPLHELAVPVLWVAGALDPGYVRVTAEAAAARGDRHHIVPGVGHNVVAEAPDLLAAVADAWVDRL